MARQTAAPAIYAGDAPLANVDADGRRFTEHEFELLDRLPIRMSPFFSKLKD